MNLGIPVIDISALQSENVDVRRGAAAKIGTACRRAGFFYVVCHGIPEQLIANIFGYAKSLFSLPDAEKRKLSIRNSRHNRGYVAFLDETLNPGSGFDRKEAFNIGRDYTENDSDIIFCKPFCGVNMWPKIDGFRDTILLYYAACLELGRILHRGFSLDLGVSENFFDLHLTEPIANLRLLHYPGGYEAVGREDGGAGAHTDYGNITVLALDEIPGLEVSDRMGHWFTVPYVKNGLLINIGDMLMRWSNDTYKSTAHRVRIPESDRYAVAFFLEPNANSVIDPMGVTKLPPKYGPVLCSDYLAGRLDETYAYRRA